MVISRIINVFLLTLFSVSYVVFLLTVILYFGTIKSNNGVLFCVLLHLLAGATMVRLKDQGAATHKAFWPKVLIILAYAALNVTGMCGFISLLISWIYYRAGIVEPLAHAVNNLLFIVLVIEIVVFRRILEAPAEKNDKGLRPR